MDEMSGRGADLKNAGLKSGATIWVEALPLDFSNIKNYWSS